MNQSNLIEEIRKRIIEILKIPNEKLNYDWLKTQLTLLHSQAIEEERAEWTRKIDNEISFLEFQHKHTGRGVIRMLEKIKSEATAIKREV